MGAVGCPLLVVQGGWKTGMRTLCDTARYTSAGDPGGERDKAEPFPIYLLVTHQISEEVLCDACLVGLASSG